MGARNGCTEWAHGRGACNAPLQSDVDEIAPVHAHGIGRMQCAWTIWEFMTKLQKLREAYEREIRKEWPPLLAGPQKVWFAVYSPWDERALRATLAEWDMATASNSPTGIERRFWRHDLTSEFGAWIESLDAEYQEAFWSEPHQLQLPLQTLYGDFLARRLRAKLESAGAQDVIALFGVASLFGFASLSQLIERVGPHIAGRLLVFFPGERNGSVYRLLEARDGWNYHAFPLG